MKTIKVNPTNIGDGISSSEEIVIQMDEDGYRVTSTTSTLESPTISSVETSQTLNEKPPQSDLLLEGSSCNIQRAVSH